MLLFLKCERNSSDSELMNNNDVCLMKPPICKATPRPRLDFQQEENLTHPRPKVGDKKELMI